MRNFRPSTAKALCLCAPALTMLILASWPAESSSDLRAWREYRTIMWIGDTAYQHPEKLPLFFQRLREMGINTAMVFGDGDPQPLVDNHFPYYVENLVNRGLCLKFNSNVRDWDKFVTDWANNGRPESSLVRDYCLDDPQWLDSARKAVGGIIGKNKAHQPLAYNLRDELSTTISANPFDYDFNPVALEHFRAWLKTQYANVAALNAEWETRFGSWDEVRPFTTDQIKDRMAAGEALPRGHPDWQQVQQLHFEPEAAQQHPTRWNFSPWADFRSYMDTSLARALDNLRQAAHEIDPNTPVGIEGTQMPDAFGGYDLWRLSQVLDWVEPYDIGGARQIFGSFMRHKPILTTVFESETRQAKRRLWHLLLEGDRGCLVWWSEDCIDWKNPEWPLTPKAKALTPVLQEMISPLAQLFLRAEPEYDPVYIHYSQPSIQVDWLLESTVDGSTWLRRFSSFEAEHNQMAKTRTACLKALQDLGYSPQFVSSPELEQGKFTKMDRAILVLPNSWALSERECAAIESFLDSEPNDFGFHRIFADGPAGVFDEHGKLRNEPSEGFERIVSTNTACLVLAPNGRITRISSDSRSYLAARLKKSAESAWLDWLNGSFRPLRPAILIPQAGRVRIHRFRIKTGRLVAFERNIDYQMSEDLKQGGGNQVLETPLQTEAILPEPAYVYDLRSETYLGHMDHIRFTLDPWQPSLFAILPEKLPTKSIVAELGRE
jgi:glycosyl hydrolase family 42 (putative beta-galactosidase)